MISKQSGTFWNVREIVSLFQQMGCEINIAEDTIESGDGDCFNVRYLLNPSNKAFVPLVDLGDDQYISKWEVESWERRLAIGHQDTEAAHNQIIGATLQCRCQYPQKSTLGPRFIASPETMST